MSMSFIDDRRILASELERDRSEMFRGRMSDDLPGRLAPPVKKM